MNAMDPMGEDLVHDNAVDPVISNRFECAYCGMQFFYRNCLFRHLRENGIDTRSLRSPHSPRSPHNTKMRKRTRSYRGYATKPTKRRVIQDLAECLQHVSIM